MKIKTNVYINRVSYTGRLNVCMIMDDGRRFSAFQQPVIKELEEHEAAQDFLQIDNDTAQQFMDQLWTCGIRPSEGTGSAGQLAATERHLGDLKAIAFGLLKKHGV